jgi:hypothetical protein
MSAAKVLCVGTHTGSDVTACGLVLHARCCTMAFSCCIMHNFHTVQSLLLHQLFTNHCKSLLEDQNVANPCNIRARLDQNVYAAPASGFRGGKTLLVER